MSKRDEAKSAKLHMREAKKYAHVAKEKLEEIGDKETARKCERIEKAAEAVEEEISDKLDPQKG